MRFILNFIFFGVLFYAIYLIFPDTFHTLVGWANGIYEFIRDVVLQIIDKYHDVRGDKEQHPHPAAHALLFPLGLRMMFHCFR